MADRDGCNARVQAAAAQPAHQAVGGNDAAAATSDGHLSARRPVDRDGSNSAGDGCILQREPPSAPRTAPAGEQTVAIEPAHKRRQSARLVSSSFADPVPIIQCL